MEVLVTVLLLSTLGIALWSGVSVGVRLGRRALGDALAAARLVRMDAMLRQAAERVRTPFWEPGPVVETGPDWLRIAWLDGDPSKGIQLERRGDLLIVHVGDGGPVAFGPFAGIEFGLYRGDGDGPRGLQVSVAGPGKGDEDPQSILAPFGGYPVAREYAP